MINAYKTKICCEDSGKVMAGCYHDNCQMPTEVLVVEPKTATGKPCKIRIHVNQHNIKKAIKGEDLPVITVKRSGDNFYCYGVKLTGTSEVVYSGAGNKPLLSCGARVVIETESDVCLVGACDIDGGEL